MIKGPNEHERLLVASALQNITAARDLLARVQPWMIGEGRLSRTWSALGRVAEAADGPIDLMDAVATEFGGEDSDLHTLVDLHELSTAVPSSEAGRYYADQVRQAAAARELERIVRPERLPCDGDTVATATELTRKLQNIAELATTADERRRRRPVPIAEVGANRPQRLLSASKQQGSLLTVGNVLVLSGAGGIAKSPLALSIALAMAYRDGAGDGELMGGVFDGAGGSALIASYEDDPADVAYRVRQLASQWWAATDHEVTKTLRERLHVIGMAGRPLYGPDSSRGTFYAARPGPLEGWDDLWRGAELIGARLVVIDPVSSAYVGEANAAAPVREFLAAVTEQAKALKCGVLLIAHSTKAARAKGPDDEPYDPGLVAGSSHWTDGARGVLTLGMGRDGERVLRIAKCNYGPSYLRCTLSAERDQAREICGFSNAGCWQPETEAFSQAKNSERFGEPSDSRSTAGKKDGAPYPRGHVAGSS